MMAIHVGARPAFTLVLCFFWMLCCCAAQATSIQLAPGESRSLRLSGGETVIVEVVLAENRSAEVVVIALEAEFTAVPAGVPAIPELRNPIHGMPVTEVLTLVGEADGRTQFEIRSAGAGFQSDFRIELGNSGPVPGTIGVAAEAQGRDIDGMRLFALGDPQSFESALAAFQDSARLWREAVEPRRAALALLKASFVTKLLGDKKATLDLYREILNFETSIDPWIYLNLALYEMDGGQRDAVRSLLDDGLQYAFDVGDQAATSALQSATGLLYHRYGALDEARSWYEEALATAQKAGYSTQLAILANNIAGIHYVRGEPGEAFAYFDKAIAAHLERGDLASVGEVEYNKGSLYFRLGEMQLALPVLLDALEKNSAHEKDSEQVAYTTAKIGSALLYLGQFEQARSFLASALELHQQHESWNQYAGVVLEMGHLERAEGRTDVAVRLHEDAIRRFREIGRQAGEMRANLALAADFLELGDTESATRSAEDALQLGSMVDDPSLSAAARLVAGKSHIAAGNLAEAIRELLRAESEFSEIGDIQAKASAQTALGRAHRQAGDAVEALRYARLAQANVNDLRAKIPPADLRARFFALQLEPYDLEIDIHMQAFEMSGDLAHAWAALRTAELASARSLVERTGARDSRAPDAPGPNRLQQEINGKLIAARSFARQQNPAELARAERDLQTLLLRAAESDAGASGRRSSIAVEELHQAVGENSQLLRYWITDADLYWWRVDKAGLGAGRAGNAQEIAADVELLHRSLRAPGRTNRGSLRRLAQWLLDASPGLAERTYVVADGILSLVPFQLLASAIAEEFSFGEIIYLPRAASLLDMSATEIARIESALVYSDPIYEATDTRRREGGGNTARTSPGIVQNAIFRRLPRSADEGLAIRDRLADGATEWATGAGATKASVLRRNEIDVDLLHFAVHAVADARLPELSSLVLGAYDNDGPVAEQFLTLHEIYELPLDVQLVVLSACDTNIGKHLRGEGVLGLSRGFVATGANAVVSTLWPVSDKATAEFMELFYEHLLTGGQTPAAALAAAQRDIRTSPRYGDPYFWAAFVLLAR